MGLANQNYANISRFDTETSLKEIEDILKSGLCNCVFSDYQTKKITQEAKQ